MNRHLTPLVAPLVVFLAGLAVVGWVGAGYAGTNALALAVTLLIGGFYVGGAFELRRYRQATATLPVALANLAAPPTSLGVWLDSLHPSLRNAVRLRVEGERVALPGPSMTPYLVGLLVLLGMLGTFLGMVGTLRSTGVALESAADLQAIRASLAAPVKGLGFAFGTSVAGVATSAMLGLLSTLARRERVQAAQMLDERIATTLRTHSRHHQHDTVFALLQRQAELMPTLVDRLETMATTMTRQNEALGERLSASQDAFHTRTEAAYARLADTVGQSLKEGIADSARAASTAIQPAVDTTMTGLAREAATMRDTVTQTVRQHLDDLSTRFGATTTAVAETWRQALAEHQQVNASLTSDLRASLDGFGETFAQRSTALVDGMSTRLDTAAADAARTWDTALSRLEHTGESLASANRQAMADASAAFAQHAADVAGTVNQSHANLQSQLAAQETERQTALAERDEARLAAWRDTLAAMAATMRDEWQRASTQSAADQQAVRDALAQSARDIATHAEAHATGTLTEIDRLLQTTTTQQAELAARDEQRLATWRDTLATMAATMRDEWQQASSQSAAHQQDVRDALTQSAHDIAAHAQTHASGTVAEIDRLLQAASTLQAELASRDEQRLAAWRDTLATMAATMRDEWQQASTQSAEHQREIRDALARTASDIATHTQEQANGTIAEVARLAQIATEAPKAAADVIAELRQKLTDGMARDNAMLEERGRLLETLGTLLDAVNHASTEQRAAVDGLVTTTADLLERVGTRFTEQVAQETGKLDGIAAQVTGSAVEVASLGEAFGMAVQVFSASNDKLAEHLTRIESALDKSMMRSDEQLAYYVAQAREVVDLSMLSQKQILENLQQFSAQQAGAEAA
ncbi:DUF802 domain-containing protein [Cupriavidus metallidurans]|uniref:DUF802 domain-containing protein n=1 Tax=Cupriavidus metallidurans TaxID=119219 RepID=UPI001CCCDF18|nr:DUF802 domain-containing protein [Cupriavidus metallidurans]UBM08420.1 DUF802 domain-containing protein [Cupriavidus metallidurans]